MFPTTREAQIAEIHRRSGPRFLGSFSGGSDRLWGRGPMGSFLFDPRPSFPARPGVFGGS